MIRKGLRARTVQSLPRAGFPPHTRDPLLRVLGAGYRRRVHLVGCVTMEDLRPLHAARKNLEKGHGLCAHGVTNLLPFHAA